MEGPKYKVSITKSAAKTSEKMPLLERKYFRFLLKDLIEKGPIQKSWKNFSELSPGKYHCHISYKWVVCWRNEKDKIVIEVYYAGSREKAPY
jgi:mRNA-degrading endonuclease RelE of RelBE toxin-antitoxin system